MGLNLVSPEAHPTALQLYWLHMHCFRFIRRQYPDVKVSLHAGELALGLVPPADLDWHVGGAVGIAAPHRIGHGVSLVYERNVTGVLEAMKAR